jgi:Zn-dependent protease with chaperone function
VTVGALAGFALVFGVVACAMSVICAVVHVGTRGWLRRLGPMAERRAAEAVAVVPIAFAVIAVVTLVAQSAFGLDHCAAHDHHAHLCLTHGAQWIERAWVVAALAAAAAAVAGRAIIMVVTYARGARSIRALDRVSHRDGEVRIVDSERAFCFVTRGGVYVSARVWSALSRDERVALLAHETAHVRQGDLRKRVVLEALLVLAAPFVADRARRAWLQASERLCDAQAVKATGDPATVASAMVAMCRMQASAPAPGFAFTPALDELAGRIRAVLAGGPLGERAALVLGRVVAVSCATVAIIAAAAADPIHHAFETLLG